MFKRKKKNTAITLENLPVHVGIIMDGNGRWAKKRGLPRQFGHKQGADVFKQTITDCDDIGIKYVTFYAFSTENWSRPKQEIDTILDLIRKLSKELETFLAKNARMVILGDKTVFPEDLRKCLYEIEERSLNNTGITVCIALNYGGRAEIVNAAKKVAMLASQGMFNIDDLTEEEFSNYLYTRNIPDTDLIIRPSGEQRLSNFLIWQSAYAEFVFMDVLWPDFNKTHLIQALEIYSNRQRRFGGV